jgi:hypothetical protein
MKLGTILPTARGMRDADDFADRQDAIALRAAAIELAGLERRTVGGEVRYYLNATTYTRAIPLHGRRRWFEVRADGDYPISAPAIRT